MCPEMKKSRMVVIEGRRTGKVLGRGMIGRKVMRVVLMPSHD